MKYYILINAYDGIIVEVIDGKPCEFCNTAFVYKSDKIYRMVDIETGMFICQCKKKKWLEEYYHELYEKRYLAYRNTVAYKIKVERFEKLKLSYNYKGGK